MGATSPDRSECPAVITAQSATEGKEATWSIGSHAATTADVRAACCPWVDRQGRMGGSRDRSGGGRDGGGVDAGEGSAAGRTRPAVALRSE